MASTIYLSSVDGSDSDDGSTWALAKATLAAALTAAGAGGTVYVDNAHAETQGSSITLTSPGTSASPTLVLCASRASGAPPTTLATTGTVSATVGNITFGGVAYCYGLTFTTSQASSVNIQFNATGVLYWRLEACSLRNHGTGTTCNILFGKVADSNANAHLIELVNTVVSFSTATNKGIQVGGARLRWMKTASAVLGTLPTTLFISNSTGGSPVVDVMGVDLSALGSGKNLVSAAGTNKDEFYFTDCKLGSSVAITTGSITGQGGVSVDVINCDSGDTQYRNERYRYQGTETTETTIVRSGGATDGTTSVSRKMVSSANANFCSPLDSEWMLIWNTALGSALTLAIPVVTDNVTLTDAEAWIEVEGLSTSGFPLGGFASDRAADILATAANQTTDGTSSWTTTGLATPVKQVLSTTITPQEIGFIRARVCLAKASTTMYFDPAPIDGSWVNYGAKQYMVGADGVVQVAAGSGGVVVPTSFVGVEGLGAM